MSIYSYISNIFKVSFDNKNRLWTLTSSEHVPNYRVVKDLNIPKNYIAYSTSTSFEA